MQACSLVNIVDWRNLLFYQLITQIIIPILAIAYVLYRTSLNIFPYLHRKMVKLLFKTFHIFGRKLYFFSTTSANMFFLYFEMLSI